MMPLKVRSVPDQPSFRERLLGHAHLLADTSYGFPFAKRNVDENDHIETNRPRLSRDA